MCVIRFFLVKFGLYLVVFVGLVEVVLLGWSERVNGRGERVFDSRMFIWVLYLKGKSRRFIVVDRKT